LGENEEEEGRKRMGWVGMFGVGSGGLGEGDRARETGSFLHYDYEVYLSL
jgi:hypothetical protein